jgi:hypothetical protein
MRSARFAVVLDVGCVLAFLGLLLLGWRLLGRLRR